ncbi:hypothetical protein B7P43_G16196 [Cryptotermes secundus]|uniref:PiggyBac transposable element-derived protein domain-containing protein n=1 Tax=Cryptotermes secundus TaxID=105785 RepID=A0A2J7PV42_9NEOP|nr:hypothetical protein B7P43_G16196 [Cryptotermes secundus]
MDRGAPKELKNDVKILKKGESVFSRKGQVLVQVWRDKRDVKLISTLHTAKIVESAKMNRKGGKICRPKVIGDSNKHMRGLNRADQMLRYYPCSRKTVKWTKKLVFFLLQMAALNSFILFKKYTTTEKYKKRNYKFKDFILDCVEKMTEQNKQCGEGEQSRNEVDDESIASDSSAVTPPPLEKTTSERPRKSSRGWLQSSQNGTCSSQ